VESDIGGLRVFWASTLLQYFTEGYITHVEVCSSQRCSFHGSRERGDRAVRRLVETRRTGGPEYWRIGGRWEQIHLHRHEEMTSPGRPIPYEIFLMSGPAEPSAGDATY
jgi:hypothetical protein